MVVYAVAFAFQLQCGFEPRLEIPVHPYRVAVGFTPRNEVIAAATTATGREGPIVTYSLETGACTGNYLADGSDIPVVEGVQNRSGEFFVAFDRGGNCIRIVDRISGLEAARMTATDPDWCWLRLSPDGSRLAYRVKTPTSERAAIRIYDLLAMKVVATLPANDADAEFSPDSKQLLTFGNHGPPRNSRAEPLTFWNAATGEVARETAYRPFDLRFLLDGRLVSLVLRHLPDANGDSTRTAIVFDPQDMTERLNVSGDSTGSMFRPAIANRAGTSFCWSTIEENFVTVFASTAGRTEVRAKLDCPCRWESWIGPFGLETSSSFSLARSETLVELRNERLLTPAAWVSALYSWTRRPIPFLPGRRVEGMFYDAEAGRVTRVDFSWAANLGSVRLSPNERSFVFTANDRIFVYDVPPQRYLIRKATRALLQTTIAAAALLAFVAFRTRLRRPKTTKGESVQIFQIQGEQNG